MRLDHLLSKEKAEFGRDAGLKAGFVVQFSGLAATPREHGGVAQMGEHLPCKQGVEGSNPFISTRLGRVEGEGWTDQTEWAHSSVG